MHRIQRLLKRAAAAPFYRRKFDGVKIGHIVDLRVFSRMVPTTRLEDLEEARIRSGDPYSLRWCANSDPAIVCQLEYDTEAPIYLGLDRGALGVYAEALRRCWALLGLTKGDSVAIFDYGTSPISYLASSLFTPYLARGAADLLGCLPVCNDGVASMSQRAVEILRFVRPRLFFVRNDCLQPLAMEIGRQALRLAEYTTALVAVENEGLLSRGDQNDYQRRLGVPVYRLLRIDLAMFLAVECPECRLLHSWRDLYFVESAADGLEGGAGAAAAGSLVITNWFAESCPAIRYLSQVKGTIERGGCPRGRRDWRIAAR